MKKLLILLLAVLNCSFAYSEGVSIEYLLEGLSKSSLESTFSKVDDFVFEKDGKFYAKLTNKVSQQG